MTPAPDSRPMGTAGRGYRLWREGSRLYATRGNSGARLSPLARGLATIRLRLNTALKLLDKASSLVSAFQPGDTP